MCFSSYVALAPTEFHPGWDYTVQLMVSDAASAVIVTGTIYNSQKTSLGVGSVTLTDGELDDDDDVGLNVLRCRWRFQSENLYCGSCSFSLLQAHEQSVLRRRVALRCPPLRTQS